MEVSSHALDQHRVDGMQFAAVCFTNLTHEHLDYHGTLDAYFEAKASLFTRACTGRGRDQHRRRARRRARATRAATTGLDVWTYAVDDAGGRRRRGDRRGVRRRTARVRRSSTAAVGTDAVVELPLVGRVQRRERARGGRDRPGRRVRVRRGRRRARATRCVVPGPRSSGSTPASRSRCSSTTPTPRRARPRSLGAPPGRWPGRGRPGGRACSAAAATATRPSGR